MSKNRMNIVDTSTERSDYIPSRHLHGKQLEAKFERLWLIDPERFNPLRNCLQKERLDRTFALLNRHLDLEGKNIVDIGCGSGVFSRRLRDGGAYLDAVDIAQNALNKFSEFDRSHIKTIRDTMPETKLPDENYDAVVSLELIAELPSQDYRLYFAEIARIIKPNGRLICSSAIDIYSEDGVERLLDFARTEFDIIDMKKSYYALFIRLKKIFSTPSYFVKAQKDKEFYKKEMQERKGLDRLQFYLNTSFFFVWIWMILSVLLLPVLKLMKNSRSLLLRLEKICQFISDEAGVSHLIFIAKRRPIENETEPEEQPLERLKKREVWE